MKQKSGKSMTKLPMKIKPLAIPAQKTTQQEWKANVLNRIKQYKKALSKNGSKDILSSFDYTDAITKRRAEAIANSMDTVYSRYYCSPEEWQDHNILGENWIDLNLGLCSYSYIEAQSSILFAAAIWMLDQMAEDRESRSTMYEYLSQDESILDYIFTPNVWDCHHSLDLISSVQYVLHFRYEDISPIETDTSGNERVLTSDLTAEGKHRAEAVSRKNFEGLISLIPQSSIDRATGHFERCFWQWADRCISGLKAMESEYLDCLSRAEKVRLEYNHNCDLLEDVIKKRDEQSASLRSASGIQKRNPLMAQQQVPVAFPDKGPFASSGFDRLFSDPVEGELQRIANRGIDLSKQMDELIDEMERRQEKKSQFMLQLSKQGSISEEICRKQYGDAVAATMGEIQIGNPYELCFALVYLIDQGSDLPWLYGVGTGLMQEVAAALPWGIIEYRDADDELWADDPETVRAKACEDSSKKLADIPDWYSRSYISKSKDEFSFARSLSQIIYEETGCVMPRDLHRYDPKLQELKRYGIRGKDAIALLYCMVALGNAKRMTPAWNFEETADEAMLLQTETETSDAEIAALRNEIKKLKTSLHESERSARETRKELASLKFESALEHRELSDLREVIFNQEIGEQEKEPEDEAIQFPYEIQHETLVFGGHVTWSKEIKPRFTGNIRFIDKELLFDPTIIRHADMIWIQTNAMSHKQYYRIIDAARQFKKPVRYFVYASAEKCARQIIGQEKANQI